MSEQIHVAGIPHAWPVLRKMKEMADLEELDCHGISHWMDAKDLAWAVECMKHLDDEPGVFTGGKWATIQNLQALVGRAASAAVGRK